jgi:hypothetical protein
VVAEAWKGCCSQLNQAHGRTTSSRNQVGGLASIGVQKTNPHLLHVHMYQPLHSAPEIWLQEKNSSSFAASVLSFEGEVQQPLLPYDNRLVRK